MATEAVAPAGDAALLSLTQWLSPAFPVGGYAFSQGLEWAIAEGVVASAEDLAVWLGDVLAQGAGRSDAIMLSLAQRDAMPLGALVDLARALAPSRERWEEAEAQGAAFAAGLAALGRPLPEGVLPYAVAVGLAARGLGVAPQQVAALWLQGMAGNLVQVAVRFVPLGQADGQRVLAGLQPLILRLAAEAATAGPEAIGSAAFGADLASMQHEVMEVRLCRT